MKSTFLLVCFALTIASCGSGELDQKKYEEEKEKLAKKERENPLTFLSVIGTNKKNFIGQTVVKAIIQNNASVTAYSDVRIKMLFFKNGLEVENHEDVVDKIIPANNSVNFNSKYFTPKGTDSVALSIMSAKYHRPE